MARNTWTDTAIECYERKCSCNGCSIQKIFAGSPYSCQMKKSVIEIFRVSGPPGKEQKDETLEKILKLLEEGPKTTIEIKDSLNFKYTNTFVKKLTDQLGITIKVKHVIKNGKGLNQYSLIDHNEEVKETVNNLPEEPKRRQEVLEKLKDEPKAFPEFVEQKHTIELKKLSGDDIIKEFAGQIITMEDIKAKHPEITEKHQLNIMPAVMQCIRKGHAKKVETGKYLISNTPKFKIEKSEKPKKVKKPAVENFENQKINQEPKQSIQQTIDISEYTKDKTPIILVFNINL